MESDLGRPWDMFPPKPQEVVGFVWRVGAGPLLFRAGPRVGSVDRPPDLYSRVGKLVVLAKKLGFQVKRWHNSLFASAGRSSFKCIFFWKLENPGRE